MAVTLILGGARSGKSSYAEYLAKKLSNNVAYIATAQALDNEMAKRIAMHRLSRPSYWETYEEPLNVANILQKNKAKHEVFLLDCLTLLISNILLKDINIDNLTPEIIQNKEEIIVNELKKILFEAKTKELHLLIVSNEIGLGLVPADSISRGYRDIVGRANQLLAGEADQVFIVWAGIPLQIKPNLERMTN